jgi:hypothetical protein
MATVVELTNAIDKLVVTNVAVLVDKYGSARRRIRSAIRTMITADADRGITTALADLSDERQLSAAGAPPVTDPSDPTQVKAAIDAVCDATAPDYVLSTASEIAPFVGPSRAGRAAGGGPVRDLTARVPQRHVLHTATSKSRSVAQNL